MFLAQRFGISLVVALLIVTVSVVLPVSLVSASASNRPDANGLEPVVDVEQLMENVVNPAYLGVKKELSEKPANPKAWKNVRSGSILIGESGNLLLFRKPEQADAKDWTTLAVGLREAGKEMFQAAKTKNYDTTKKAYAAVVDACNKCHGKFAENGEPKIEP